MEQERTLLDAVLEKMPSKHDYSFIDEATFRALAQSLTDFEDEYIESIPLDADGAAVYDDDAAFEFISEKIKAKYPDLETYANAITDDYLDISEEYMSDTGAIEWD